MGQASQPEVPVSFRRLSKLPVPARRALVWARRWSHFGPRPHPRVAVDVKNGVAVITFDDGKVNAFSKRMNHVFAEALDRVEANDQVRALVVSGRPGQFSAGFDLDTLMVGGKQRDTLIRDGWTLLERLFTLPVPVVIACTGNAVALGAAILLAGDRRLGADGDFKIGFNEASIGLPLPETLLILIRDRLREDIFEEATYGARLYRPQEAVTAGFLHRVVAPPDLLDTAIAEAQALSAGPADTFRREKETRIGPISERMRRQLEEDMTLIKRIGS
ncbi:crotonase/enoyl-CoA hydratase family protein [Mycolicibacterium xanthum]|uniref:crotonase/enoyl-CoA hydratase family protein n=1 Tax=Mycolicibacterium xanthum TaxID=2796469 RepID=UPI0021030A76|nr:crotonase/enoyl-CoA hydratase family protein [Mycolicibacterium xanthum]